MSKKPIPHPDDIFRRAEADLEHLREADAADEAAAAKIAARRVERAARIAKIEAFIEQFAVYAAIPPSEPISYPLRQLPDSLLKAANRTVHKRGGGKLGPVAAAILSLEGLSEGMKNAEIIEVLRAKHPELALPEKDVKAVYNALYGLTKTGRLSRDEGEDGAYRLPPKQIDPPKAKANGGSIPGHVNGSHPSHVLDLQPARPAH